jgi:rhodanese-related sulfurtransferase
VWLLAKRILNNPSEILMSVRSDASRVVLESAILVACAAVLALATNALRSKPLPLIAQTPYETVVPCPEANGEVETIQPSSELVREKGSFVIDARSSSAFDQWHLQGATNIPFDYLEPTSPEKVRLVTSSRSKRVVVYGDGQDPDCGRELGRELSGKGLRNVFVIKGGAPALQNDAPKGANP